MQGAGAGAEAEAGLGACRDAGIAVSPASSRTKASALEKLSYLAVFRKASNASPLKSTAKPTVAQN